MFMVNYFLKNLDRTSSLKSIFSNFSHIFSFFNSSKCVLGHLRIKDLSKILAIS